MTPQALPYCFACIAARSRKGRRVLCLLHGSEVAPSHSWDRFHPFNAPRSELAKKVAHDRRSFARPDSIYKSLPGCDVFDLARDARTYNGSYPVIAHPPCRAWGRLRSFAKPRPDEEGILVSFCCGKGPQLRRGSRTSLFFLSLACGRIAPPWSRHRQFWRLVYRSPPKMVGPTWQKRILGFMWSGFHPGAFLIFRSPWVQLLTLWRPTRARKAGALSIWNCRVICAKPPPGFCLLACRAG